MYSGSRHVIGWPGGVNTTDTVFITERFNVLWKANWTHEAEAVLKAFEKDVIRKVRQLESIN